MANLPSHLTWSDIILVVVRGGQQFHVHKAYLTAKSPVFEAMFRNCTSTESLTNRVDIPDIDGDVFEALLQFVYNEDIGTPFENIADKLLIASDKYQIDPLKQFCEHHLSSRILPSNVLNLLLLADYTSSSYLKSKCIECITKNFKTVTQSSKWKQLISSRTHEQLVEQVLHKPFKKKNNNSTTLLSNAESQESLIVDVSTNSVLRNYVTICCAATLCATILLVFIFIMFFPIEIFTNDKTLLMGMVVLKLLLIACYLMRNIYKFIYSL